MMDRRKQKWNEISSIKKSSRVRKYLFHFCFSDKWEIHIYWNFLLYSRVVGTNLMCMFYFSSLFEKFSCLYHNVNTSIIFLFLDGICKDIIFPYTAVFDVYNILLISTALRYWFISSCNVNYAPFEISLR